MHKKCEPFNYHVWGEGVGEVWISLIDSIMSEGEIESDEGRSRKCLQNVVYQIHNPEIKDKIVEDYGNKEQIDGIIYLTFKGEEMYDFDVVPSFSPGARSYYARIKEGRMYEYVIKRLSKIPESKKGVISFIHWDDYKSVLDTPYDDYLPCITTVQCRLIATGEKKWKMNIIAHARSLDAFQKANGNFMAITMLAHKFKKELSENLKGEIEIGVITGMITDVHIYEECFDEAKKIINSLKKKDD